MSPLHCESKRKCSPSFGRGQQMWQQICITVAAFMEENWSFFFFSILLFSPNPLDRELMISVKWDSKICAGVWLSYVGSGKFTGAFLGVGYNRSCTCVCSLSVPGGKLSSCWKARVCRQLGYKGVGVPQCPGLQAVAVQRLPCLGHGKRK